MTDEEVATALRLDKYDAAALARIAKTLHGNGHFGGAATLAMVTKELESYIYPNPGQ